jgi:hypothetical protein
MKNTIISKGGESMVYESSVVFLFSSIKKTRKEKLEKINKLVNGKK